MAARGFARMLAGHLEADISVRFYYFGQQPILVVVPAEKKKERKKKELVINSNFFSELITFLIIDLQWRWRCICVAKGY
jgi:hypothetical protein